MTALVDPGASPYVMNIEQAAIANDLYRVTVWTGGNLQATVMAIPPGGDVGLEVHEDHDQFLRVEAGSATVYLGPSAAELTASVAQDGSAVFVPAGTWHNLVNSGQDMLKLYSIYAPPEHARGTVHRTQAEAEAAEH